MAFHSSFRLCLYGLLVGAAAQSTTTATTCLPNAVPIGERKELIIDGVLQPLGIWRLNWQSANMNAQIFKLLAEEVLGYKTVEPGASAVVVSGLWAIVGCDVVVSLESEIAEKCPEVAANTAVSKSHLVFETWDFYLPATLKTLATEKYVKRAPLKLGGVNGNLGFRGISVNWLPKESFVKAKHAFDKGEPDGLILDSYHLYNASRYSPVQYFDSLAAINTTEFYNGASRCKDYPPMNEDLDARDYLRHFPNDPDGVEEYAAMENGSPVKKLRGRCEDGVWWLSPACRANRSACIPWISVVGYGYSIMWHKATYFNMPIAMASTMSWVDVIHDNKVLNYAWIPDALFRNRGLQQLLFPGFKKEEHADNFYRTEFAQVATEKWGHPELEKAAPRVFGTATRMNMSSSKMVEILEYQAENKLSGPEGACHFLKNNRELWEGWVPSITNCLAGQGLYPGTEEEWECKWCPRATYSKPGMIPNTEIFSRSCVPCEPGRFQANTQTTSCELCSAGTVTSEYGREECQRCSVGKHMVETGQTECVTCPLTRTTVVEAAIKHKDCVCPEGSYEPAGVDCDADTSSCTCNDCSEGLDCGTGSRLDLWKAQIAGDKSAVGTTPLIEEGFYSLSDNPVSVYACKEKVACPGGMPESCSGGRFELTCTRCPAGTYLSSTARECLTCDGLEIYLMVFGIPVAIIALTVAHIAVNFPQTKTQKTTMSGVFLVGMAVTTVLTFNIYANLAFVAVSPLAELFGALKIFAFDMELMRFGCVMGTDSQISRYATKMLGIPIGFVMMALGVGCVAIIPRFRKQANFNFTSMQNSMGLLISIFFITVSNMSLEAFRCEEHPNDKRSLTSDRSVICWEGGDHAGLVRLSIVAILVYPVPYLTITGMFTYFFYPLTKKYGIIFSLRSRFLFNRMNPDSFYFGFWYNLRNFILTLVPVITIGLVAEKNRYAVQVFLLMLCFVSWLVVQLYYQPWRFSILNKFDAFTSAFQILMLTCFAMLQSAAKGQNSAETAGAAIVFLFSICLLCLIVGGIERVVSRVLRKKDFGIFLTHHKDSAGRFARQLKLMLGRMTPRRIFLDVDELEDLDNLNFTIRTNTENLCVVVTEECLGRLWVAVEIVSAHLNSVPLYMVQIYGDRVAVAPQLIEDIHDAWTHIDHTEFSKAGVTADEVKAAYTFLSSAPTVQVSMEASFDAQMKQSQELVRTVHNCATREKTWALDAEQNVYIGLDTSSMAQTCCARIIDMLFREKHWTTHSADGLKESKLNPNSVLLMLISRNVPSNPESLGFVIAACRRGVPVVTMLSGEDFEKPSESILNDMREFKGPLASIENWELIQAYAPGATIDNVIEALQRIYKVLAWRFNPQDSDAVMRTEFYRISERCKIELSRGGSVLKLGGPTSAKTPSREVNVPTAAATSSTAATASTNEQGDLEDAFSF